VLVLLVVGLVGVGTAVAVWWPLFGDAGSAEGQRVTAEVVKSASCGGAAAANDTVEFKVGDKTGQAKLDGCGHRQGETFEVIVPAGNTGDVVVQMASAVPQGPSMETRLTALLLCLSALAGGLYSFLVRRAPLPTLGAGKAPGQLTASDTAA
jgi:hypothetical protein